MVSPLQSLVANARQDKGRDMGDLLRQQALTNSSLESQDLQRQNLRQQMNQRSQSMDAQQSLGAARYLNSLGKQLLATPEQQWGAVLEPNLPQLQQLGYTPEILQGMTREQVAGVVEQTNPLMQDVAPQESVGTRERQQLIKDLESENEQVRKSAEIALGLTPRAVGSASQTITELGTADQVAETERTVETQKELGKGQAKTSTKLIDDGFDKITGLQGSIRNIDRAIRLIDNGAKTGAVQRFLPSIRKSSIELNQLQNELGLDVIGGTTFGALSKGELDLALETALPKNLNEADLKDWLIRKRESQNKLLNYYQDQIDFLDQGGTIPEFLRQQREQSETSNIAPEQAAQPTGFKIISIE